MALPLVSCIVPAFNGARHIGEAIESILGQSYTERDVTVVDDGSSDDTRAVLESFGSRITIVRQRNAGPAAARNTGVAATRGPLVAFLDQDDHWHPEKLARQVNVLNARPDVDLVVAHVESYWEHSDGDTTRAADQPRAGVVPGYVTSTLLARRHALERVGPFEPTLRYVDSLDWFVRAQDLGVTVDLMPDVLLFHRVHAHNLSRQGESSRRECLRILRRAIERRRGAVADEPPA